MLKIIKRQYSKEDLPYYFIIPTLLGHTLSSGIPLDKNWSMEDSARVLNKLMVNLRFKRYPAKGGDVGSFIARFMARDYDACVGMHCEQIGT